MIAKNFALFCLVVGALSLAPLHHANASKGTTVPGKYKDWNRDIDEVTIIQSFHLDAYSDIAVASFDSSGLVLPSPKENTYQAVQSARASIKSAFIEGFQSTLRKKTEGQKPPRGKGPTLVIHIRVIRLDPGSQAARYFASFGAGAVKVGVTGEIVDAASRKTLIRFTQERRSGFGILGGSYVELFNRTASQIGEDVAGLLNAF